MNGRIKGLRTAVPYLRLYKGTTFILKVGGEVIADEQALTNFADQVSLLHQLSIDVVVVHGGGPQASELSERLGLEVETVGGRRVTDADTLEVAKMVFNGKLNTDLLAALQRSHVPSVGLSGVDGGMIRALRRPPVDVDDPDTGDTRRLDFGYVGDIEAVDPTVIRHLLAGGYVPVVSALAGGDDGAVYNVNADTIAAQLAVTLTAIKLILLTTVVGVLENPGDHNSLISHMDRERLDELLAGAAVGGMKAKLEACRQALDGGVPRTHIISGLKTDTLLTEIFTNEGSGTLIEAAPSAPVGGVAP
jgi:acetylglutamate kinase